MFRLLEVRPIMIDFERNGTTTGRPGGHRIWLCWACTRRGRSRPLPPSQTSRLSAMLPLPTVGPAE